MVEIKLMDSKELQNNKEYMENVLNKEEKIKLNIPTKDEQLKYSLYDLYKDRINSNINILGNEMIIKEVHKNKNHISIILTNNKIKNK